MQRLLLLLFGLIGISMGVPGLLTTVYYDSQFDVDSSKFAIPCLDKQPYNCIGECCFFPVLHF